ncbi:MAG: hypothetical protein IPI12_14040 [Ignavibacteriales bacterium]|jgi:hypothetical protein|nr:hypothetical protein [Ignavibacteriales bacterium]
MKLFKFLLVPVILLILSGSIVAQPQKEVVAKIGNREITAEEFILRYEMSPKFTAHVKGAVKALKEELIYTVTAEKLFALEAELLRLDTLKDVKRRIEQFEKMFARDALFKAEIVDKIDQTQQTLANEMAKAITKIKIKAIRNTDQAQINNVYNFLNNGVPFDSLFFDIYKNGYEENMLELSYGMFDYDIEEKLYQKKPGQYTEPLFYNNLWYIFYVESKRDSSFTDSKQIENEFTRVKKLYIERLTQKNYHAFKKEFFKGLKISTDGNLLTVFAGRFYEHLKTKLAAEPNTARSLSETGKWSLKSEEFYFTKAKIPLDSLQLTYFSHNSKNYSLEDFIYFLAGDVREIESVDHSKLMIKLKNWTRDYIESEVLAEEAMKRTLHKKPDVRREINIWRDYTLSNAYQALYLDSSDISDAEVMDYFVKRNNGQTGGVTIKLARAVSSDLDALASLLTGMDDGTDFLTLAKSVNGERDKEVNGNVDKYVPASDYGEAGTIALKLTPGRVFGPVKIGDEYVVMKLIDKKLEDILLVEEYDAVKDKLKRDLGFQKYYKSMVKNTASLASKFDVSIDLNKIDELKVTETNAVYFRYMGFGSRITAFPLMRPFIEWVDEWKKLKELNP